MSSLLLLVALHFISKSKYLLFTFTMVMMILVYDGQMSDDDDDGGGEMW